MAEESHIQPITPPSGGDSAPDPESSSAAGTQHSFTFTFNFDTEQLEAAWQEVAQKVEASFSVTGEQDPELEAAYWDQLEKWLLKGYQQQCDQARLVKGDRRMRCLHETLCCRPAGANPVWLRVSPPEPVASLAPISEMTLAMRRQANVRAVGLRPRNLPSFPDAESAVVHRRR